MEVLARDMRISTDQIVSILKKHEVCADSEKLQDSYRKRVGQRLMASIRDENGKRELLSAKADYSGNEYIVIDACNNIRQLQQIKYKLQKNIAGLDASISKVNCRLGFFEHFSQKLLLFRRK